MIKWIFSRPFNGFACRICILWWLKGLNGLLMKMAFSFLTSNYPLIIPELLLSAITIPMSLIGSIQTCMRTAKSASRFWALGVEKAQKRGRQTQICCSCLSQYKAWFWLQSLISTRLAMTGKRARNKVMKIQGCIMKWLSSNWCKPWPNWLWIRPKPLRMWSTRTWKANHQSNCKSCKRNLENDRGFLSPKSRLIERVEAWLQMSLDAANCSSSTTPEEDLSMIKGTLSSFLFIINEQFKANFAVRWRYRSWIIQDFWWKDARLPVDPSVERLLSVARIFLEEFQRRPQSQEFTVIYFEIWMCLIFASSLVKSILMSIVSLMPRIGPRKSTTKMLAYVL